jgi:putative chitinase
MNQLTFQKATSLSQSMAAKWYEPVNASMALYAIDTPALQAAFLAQVGHESGGFVYTREIWGPTPAQAKYEGRGLIQITGRANYQAISDDIGIDYVTSPELLEQTSGAAQSAAWFWNKRGLNEYVSDFVTLTKRINGGTNGLADREARWKIAKIALGV